MTCYFSKHNLAPPCTKAIQSVSTILLGDEPKPIGKFTPTCDEDGFFAPMQCNRNNGCWCVDRNGAEIKGTRTKGLINCGNFFLCHLSNFSKLFLLIFFSVSLFWDVINLRIFFHSINTQMNLWSKNIV